jgi:hypothetical protein
LCSSSHSCSLARSPAERWSVALSMSDRFAMHTLLPRPTRVGRSPQESLPTRQSFPAVVRRASATGPGRRLPQGRLRRPAVLAGDDGAVVDAVPQAQPFQLQLDAVRAAVVDAGELGDGAPRLEAGRKLLGLAVVPAGAGARREGALVAALGLAGTRDGVELSLACRPPSSTSNT